MEQESGFRCGVIALVGRPNVGKSTLLNALVGQKIAITSDKPQTTRHRIQGILTTDSAQFIFVDTPGFQTRYRSALNRYMNRSVRSVLEDVDVIALVVELGRYGEEDEAVRKLVPAGRPLCLVVNKMDGAGRDRVLPFLDEVSHKGDFADIVPVSALRGTGIAELLRVLERRLPLQPALFPPDSLTDRSERFLAAELVREKLFHSLGEEVPYGATVVVEKFEEQGNLRRIFASVVVAKESHKAIVIGTGGEKLKAIASAARREMEVLFGGKVYLEVWVKVRRGWTEDEQALKALGYE